MDKKLDKSAKFWIYIVTPNLWKNLDVKNMSRMATHDYIYAKKGDIIIFYVKGKGFSGMCKLSTDQMKNEDDVVIFRDKNLNRTVFDMEYFYPFKEIVQISSIINCIKSDRVGFKSIVSFRNKFLSGLFKINELDNDKGGVLYKNIVNLLDTTKETDKKRSKKTTPIKTNSKREFQKKKEKKKEKDKGTKKDNASNDTDSIASYSETSNESNKSTKSNKSNKKKQFEIVEDTPTSSEVSKETVDDMDYGQMGRVYYIPIMIIPCKSFLVPDEDEEIVNYLVDHFKRCNKCDWTNNNNIEFHSVFDTAQVEYMEVDDEDDELDDAIMAYQSLKRYKFEHNYKKTNVARIMYITDDDTYEECILLCWSAYYKQ